MKEIEDLRGEAIGAFNWSSMSPEKRGDSVIKDYSEQLKEDLTKIKELGADVEKYKEKYVRLFRNWLSAKSRCASAMVTGPSGFDNGRNEKANRSEHNRYTEWQEWRERTFTAIKRSINRKEETEKRLKNLEEKNISHNGGSYKFEGGVVEIDYGLDRIMIKYEDIPSEEERAKLKSRAFRWSPRNQAWQRKVTQNAAWAVQAVTGVKEIKIIKTTTKKKTWS